MTDPNHVARGSRWARRACALLVLASGSFTFYGSLVPFSYHERPFDDALRAFQLEMQHDPTHLESRSDGLANVMLGVPLGFALLGLCRVGTRSRFGDAVVGMLLLVPCLAFAASVEFAQLYYPDRTCSVTDVICQEIGALLGMIGWVVAGRWLLRHAEEVWHGANVAGRILVGYLVLLAIVQMLPLDLNPSPRDVYIKLRDRVVFVPFSEFRGYDNDRVWSRIATLVRVFGFYMPIGLLAARLPARFWRSVTPSKALALAVVVAFAMEALQLIVKSRSCSATDVVVGTAGMLTGWLLRRLHTYGLPLGDAIGLYAWWLLGLGVTGWQPFPPHINDPPLAFGWIPGMPLESGNPIFALEEMLTKLMVFSLGGAAIGAVELRLAQQTRILLAAVLGLLASSIVEIGQLVLGSHTPCITDALLGGAGGLLGAWIAARVKSPTAASARR